MHIVFVDRTPWWGGDTSSMFTLARGLRERNHRCDVIVDYPCEHHARFRDAGLGVLHRFASKPWWYPDQWHYRPPGANRLAKVLSAQPLGRLLRPKPNIVHFNNLMARSGIDIRTARRTGVPIVGHVRNLAHTVPLGRSVTEYCDVLIAISNYVREQLEALGALGQVTRLETIYNPVSEKDFERETSSELARQRIGVPGPGRVIGVPAVLEPRKGQDVAIRAFARLASSFPDARLLIAGNELAHALEYAESLRTLVRDAGLGDRVFFLGHCADMATFYRACDVVLAVAKDGEPFGRIPIEAALAYRATIATRAGATPELIEDGESGLLVTPGDDVSLEQAIRSVLSDPQRLEKLSQYAGARARRVFGYGPLIDQVEHVYEHLCRSQRHRRRRPMRLRHAFS